MNLSNVDKLFLSYPFIRSDHINYQIFNDLKLKSVNDNSLQRNGGAFRIIISCILTLIDAKADRDYARMMIGAESSLHKDSNDLRQPAGLLEAKQFIL